MRPDKLHVVVPYFNPFRWEKRKKLHTEFMAWIANYGCSVYVVELAIGDREFEVTDPNNRHHLQLKTCEDIPWIKENLINLGIHKLLPHDAKYVAWVDGDVRLQNPNWVMDALHELQHAPVIQLFSECMDLGPSHQAVPMENGPTDFIRHSFLKVYWEKTRKHGKKFVPGEAYDLQHCGYAWAARLDFLRMIDNINPLLDFSLVGSADWIMACCFVGEFKKAAHGEASKGYLRRVEVFHQRVQPLLQKNVSHIPGLLVHHWHGRKKERNYMGRWKILIDTKFDPDLDLRYRRDGLLIFSGRNPELPLMLRAHGRAKNEDSIDTY